MSFIQELQQNLMNNRMNLNLNLFSAFFSSANDILLFIISLVAIIGIYFWYLYRAYSSQYLFENPTKLTFFYDLITKGLSGLSGLPFKYFIGVFKFPKNLYLISVLMLLYYFFGITAVIFIIILGLLLILKLINIYQTILKEEGVKNNNYISTKVIIASFNKYLILAYKLILSKNLIYIIVYLLISLILYLIRIEYFYSWGFILIVILVIYIIKCIKIGYEIKLLQKKPLFSTVEYISGEIESNLILYQTTPTDYRFKQKNTRDELIIPATSIKKINYDYDSELNDLENAINFKIIEYDSIAKEAINRQVENIVRSLKPIQLYRKAVIYSKKNNFENAEKCLAEAIKLDNKYKNIAKYDADFENIRNENWFVSLIDIQENKK